MKDQSLRLYHSLCSLESFLDEHGHKVGLQSNRVEFPTQWETFRKAEMLEQAEKWHYRLVQVRAILIQRMLRYITLVGTQPDHED